jgi:hypothetical protein
MTRRERPLGRDARRRTTKTQRRITQDGIQYLKFMAMSSRDNAVASAVRRRALLIGSIAMPIVTSI